MEETKENLIPESDRDFLTEKGYDFDITPMGGNLYLVIKNFEFPETYTPRNADLMIEIPAGYPNAKLDMFWTNPDIKLLNGGWPTACEYHKDYVGRNWQRWSRHHGLEWRSGIDNLRTFLAAVKKEIQKGI